MLHFQFAYLDPGSGSILVQVVMGGVLGGAYVLRKWVAGIVTSVRPSSKSAAISNSDSTES